MESYSDTHFSYLHAKVLHEVLNRQQLLGFVIAFAVIVSIIYLFKTERDYDDGLFIVNKPWSWEPAFFARLRWITNAQQIITDADKQAQGRPYRLARGDTDMTVLPPTMIPELNRLGLDVLNSRESHAFGLLGHLTGMDVVRKTSFHVRVLLSYISPALPRLFALMGERISARIEKEFPQGHEWTVMKPSKAVVCCISEAIALTLFGEKMTEDNPTLVQLMHEHTNNVFQVCFAMRCVPQPLQPLLVWLLPGKWRLISGWKQFRNYVVPRVQELKEASCDTRSKDPAAIDPDVISWMVADGRNQMERDPEVLTTLVGSIAAGSTYSIANFCCRTIVDLIAHPDVLDAVRAEIRDKHVQIHGRWDMAAVASLDRLESAMKETSRLSPGTLFVYGRVVKKDHVLSNGLALKKGQLITMSSATRTMDPAIFEDPSGYRGLRFCADDRIEEHRARPFSSIDTDILAWGVGRWACPGRLITDMSAKILLVKLLDEYDIAFVGDKPLARSSGLISAQSTTVTQAPVQTVVNLFLGAKRESNYSFAGSVVAADATATTYEVRCKYGALNLPGFPTTTCDMKDPPWTVTEGPSTMIGVLTTAIETVSAVLAETCSVEGRTAAYCNYTFVGDHGGSTTSTAYTTVITGDKWVEYPVTITAGAELLAAAAATTALSSSSAPGTSGPSAAAAGSSSANGAVSNGVRVGVLKVIVLAAVVFALWL
ncbi:Ent-kaurene oxidase [Diplogelasinospora grovesii]|uniref:Ent-kaurene oxidase n=1 Tax=Diplogelasinospora grovesii TaxID=303347 RepID=A0AAN6S7F0_9PEZI|nr:Ent-kaurene oxidase [Diplogelasinospora grovesii]